MTLRATALLALAAFAVHELRYLLVPDAHAGSGHGYLAAAPVFLALLLALALGHSLAALGRRGSPGRGLSWAAATGALVAVHGGQELLERLIAGGGPVDAGLLLVVPLSAAAGALVALALRSGERMLQEAGARVSVVVPPAPAPAAVLDFEPVRRPPGTGLARHLAGRAPPAFG